MGDDPNKPLKWVAKPLVPLGPMPAPIWLIKGVLPEGFLTLLQGLPGSLKTYIAVSIVCCLATGTPWLGRRVKQCKVLFIAADDPDGPRMRAQAWCKYHGVPFEDVDAALFDRAVNLYHENEVNGAIEEINRQALKPDLIVWDTLFHSSVGADLMLAKDVLPIMGHARKMMAGTGAHSGLPIHHTPKDGKGTYGSVTIAASVDVILNSEKSLAKPNTTTLSCERMRRARAFDPIDIEFASIQVETLPDDEGVTLVEQIVAAGGEPATTKASKKQDDLSNMELVLETVLKNHATRTQWMTAMQKFGRGWAEANFDKKLGALKAAKRVTGGGAQGEHYSVAYTDEARAARGAGTGTRSSPTTSAAPAESPHPETTLTQKHPHLIPLEGNEGMRVLLKEPQEHSNHPHEGSEGGSREGRNENSSVATDPAEKVSPEEYLAAAALAHLKGPAKA